MGQHEWEATFARDEQGRPLPPRFHLLLLGDVVRTPTSRDQSALETLFAELERRHPYGPAGLLTTLGWGTTWFERFTHTASPVNRPVKMARWEDPVLEDYDFFIHLASDEEAPLHAAKGLLFGPEGTGLDGVLRLRDERTGFVGAGLPAERVSSVAIPESSPLLFGFRSVYRKSQAPEETVTIREGEWAGGTTAHVSRIVLNLEQWHAKDRDEQSALLHAPTVSAAEAEAFVDDAPSDHLKARATVAEHGIIGHAQAAARARVNDVPLINRRDFATLDDGAPGTHFVSLQRELRDFNNTRAIMNGSDAADAHPAVGARHRNGINSFMTVTRRATFIIPPRRLRAFPHLTTRGHEVVAILTEELATPIAEVLRAGAIPGADGRVPVLREALDLIRASAWGEAVVSAVLLELGGELDGELGGGLDGVAAELDAVLGGLDGELAAIVRGHLRLVRELLSEHGQTHLAGDIGRGHLLGAAQAVNVVISEAASGGALLSGRVRAEFPWELFDTLVLDVGGPTRFAVPTFRAGVEPVPGAAGARELTFDQVLVPAYDRLAEAPGPKATPTGTARKNQER